MRYAMTATDAQVTPYRRRRRETNGFGDTSERMKRTIKALSGGPTEVILKSNGDETVQVVHQSVSDFLKAKGLGLLANLVNASKSSVLDSSQVISQCQATLYRSCLVYLATEDEPQKILNDAHGNNQRERLSLASHPS
jgi:hypothetical protein